MSWFSRFTRSGDMHLVYGQKAGTSCGDAAKPFDYDAGKSGFHVNFWGKTQASGGNYSGQGPNMWVVHRT